MLLSRHLFPQVYMNGDRPARHGVYDENRLSRTPPYAFGWILSSLELFKALDITDEPPLKLWLYQLPELVDDRIYPQWEMKMTGCDYRYRFAQ